MKLFLCAIVLLFQVDAALAQGRRGESRPGPAYSVELRIREKIVKGAPYAAEAVTESTQTLANGTRLTQKTTTILYRDSEGRTRREGVAAPVGPFAMSDASKAPRVIIINDPVAGFAYTLYPESRTGTRAALPPAEVIRAGGEPRPPQKSEDGRPPEPKPGGDHPSFIAGTGQNAGRTESLGKREIEGLKADGERTTVVIPVNQVGNDQPIEVVEERWKSPELRLTLWSKTSDPRWGEITYRLTNINRAEPDRSLFAPPGEYAIQDSRPQGGQRRQPPPIR